MPSNVVTYIIPIVLVDSIDRAINSVIPSDMRPYVRDEYLTHCGLRIVAAATEQEFLDQDAKYGKGSGLPVWCCFFFYKVVAE